jgi:hypothetical protein
MEINSRKRAVRLKRTFFIGSVVFAVMSLLFFLINLMTPALITIGVFSVWYLYFHVADYQFIEFSTENNRIRLRYYKAISFGGTKYNEIEFQQSALKKVVFENSFFGRNSDVIFYIITQRGVAEYPSVSLSALKKDDRLKMADTLNTILATR